MSERTSVFGTVRERDVTRAIVGEFAAEFQEYAASDVVIVGAGPSGLVCASALAEAGVKVLVVERNNYLGGGFWIGGYLMSKVTVREPADAVLDEITPKLREEVHDTLEKIAWESFGPATEKIVHEIVDRVEQIAWEVIPQLAETLIKAEIRRMKGEDED